MPQKKKQIIQVETEREKLDRILEPDKNLLDEEWIAQPKLYLYWAEKLEDEKQGLDDAKREFDVVKAEFEEVKAKLDLDIRRVPDKYGLPKVTDKSVAMVMLLQPKYKKAQDTLFDAQAVIDGVKHTVGILQAVVKSLEQRKSSLENLVNLHGQKYFATPRVSGDLRETMEEVEKNSTRRRTKIKNRR